MAGLEEVERSYRRKSLEAAAAISKIFERQQIEAKAAFKEEERMMEMMMSPIGIMQAMSGIF